MSLARWKTPPLDLPLVAELMSACGLCRPIALVLANRAIEPRNADRFLNPKLSDLSDPYLIPGMKLAAERLWRAIGAGEGIVVHGDYDADGITATTLLTWVLRENGAKVDWYLPNRFDDGYGFTPESVEKAINKETRVLVTVDCGITGNAAAAAAKAQGIDVLITDHHQPGTVLPDAMAVINPRLHPEIAHLHSLAGVGVCFKLCHAFVKYGRENRLGALEFDLRNGLDLVALGTVADIVPLLGENRCLVRHGMKILSTQHRPGIRALCDIAGLNDRLRPEDIAFRIAPRLNAAGRLGDACDALRLLETGSIVDAYALARKLDACNRKRQEFEEQAFTAAAAQVDGLDLSERCALVVKGRNWHRGVIGIVASRLTQTYHRPSIALTIDDHGAIHGSGRSVAGVDLVKSLDLCKEYLVRYGGHPMASGLALQELHLASFEVAFEAAVRVALNGSRDFQPSIAVEGDALLSEMGDDLFRQLELLAPFGHCHPAPCFRFTDLHGSNLQLAGRSHTRGVFQDAQGTQFPFVAFGRKPEDFPPPPWTVAGTPTLNLFRGETHHQLQVQDVRTVVA